MTTGIRGASPCSTRTAAQAAKPTLAQRNSPQEIAAADRQRAELRRVNQWDQDRHNIGALIRKYLEFQRNTIQSKGGTCPPGELL